MKENTGDPKVLERFIKEHFPFNELKKLGFFTKEMKGDYPAQAKRVCDYFGYETVYEYGAFDSIAHLSVTNPNPNDPFITKFEGWMK